MITLLFNAIPNVLFNPFAIGALLGVFLLFFSKVEKKESFWIVTVSILFMMGWRFACLPLMISKRYFSILLYPATILTAFFCVQIEPFFFRITNRHQTIIENKYEVVFRIIPFFLVVAVTSFSLFKVFRLNPNAGGIINACRVYLENRKKNEICYPYEINGTEHHRICYYADIHNNPKDLFSLPPNSLREVEEQWLDIIHEQKNIFGTHYFFYFQRAHENDIIPSEEILADGKWRRICRCSTSRKNKKEVILYSYTPYCKNFEQWKKTIPEISSDNLCLNGNFEQLLDGEELEGRIAYYKTINASDFYFAAERLFPKNWWLGVSKPVNGKTTAIALTADDPIAGKYSLDINSNNVKTCGTNSCFIIKQDGNFTGFIRGKKRSEVFIYSCYWNINQKRTSCIERFSYIIDSNKTYMFTIPVFQKDIPKEHNSIFLVVETSGHILLDNVSFNNTQLSLGTK